MSRPAPNFRIHASTRIARGDDVFPVARRTAHGMTDRQREAGACAT